MEEKIIWRIEQGFSANGDIYIVGNGNTFLIKEELKKLNFKYSNHLGWYTDQIQTIPAPYKLFHFNSIDLFEWDNKYNKGFPYKDIETKIKNITMQKYIVSQPLSNFIGTVGGKINNLKVLFTKSKYIIRNKKENNYYIYSFKNENNSLVWFTKKKLDLQTNNYYLLSGSVATHTNYNNIKITKVTRCDIQKLE